MPSDHLPLAPSAMGMKPTASENLRNAAMGVIRARGLVSAKELRARLNIGDQKRLRNLLRPLLDGGTVRTVKRLSAPTQTWYTLAQPVVEVHEVLA